MVLILCLILYTGIGILIGLSKISRGIVGSLGPFPTLIASAFLWPILLLPGSGSGSSELVETFRRNTLVPPMVKAAYEGDLLVVQKYIAELETAESPGEIPSIEEFILKEGGVQVGIDDRDYSGKTALFMAARWGHIDIAKELVVHGADLNAEDNHGNYPIYTAAAGGHIEVVDFLIAQGANYDPERLRKYKGSERVNKPNYLIILAIVVFVVCGLVLCHG